LIAAQLWVANAKQATMEHCKMTMNKTIAQVRIARELAEAEASLNEALLRQSHLFTTMLTARRDTGVGAAIGQDALLRLAKSQQTLLSAGGDLARVHGRMLEIGKDMGVIRMQEDCPDDLTIPGGFLAIAA
jgi:hypothetical protein